ncbi:hypothetical protein BBO99_00006744 [Phytophthora kernoviae]|uniref:Uncharacterized protein n=2 Tax=Phytophthora kernoviae TaxID=325452 RepID=A0A3F2RKV4_9STRA|nr:hypothetical protein G195_007898 [Phytophthora kernoviae 00238/432]KAG2520935.1 hypothetical protein JM16_006484 [Phytophthora kernoviae]KAG2521951.1 hypothetical protein JM18_006319 [Phytophthora kernoviae]RLN05904.1 hypothetical protein BBI17_006766 [Phytophthora kernoviae]RLN52102.1 hypothetical protein BBJ29_001622 [Phytophthora kernoviae]
MAITADVKNQLFKPGNSCSGAHELIRLPADSTTPSPCNSDGEKLSPLNTNGRAWTVDEHNRFLEGLELFPSGPWKEIAAHVGSRTTRQTMTHAQKYLAATQCQFYGVTSDGGVANFGSLFGDFDPLPMSEEEIDLILEAAMVPAPLLQTHSQTEFVL